MLDTDNIRTARRQAEQAARALRKLEENPASMMRIQRLREAVATIRACLNRLENELAKVPGGVQ